MKGEVINRKEIAMIERREERAERRGQQRGNETSLLHQALIY